LPCEKGFPVRIYEPEKTSVYVYVFFPFFSYVWSRPHGKLANLQPEGIIFSISQHEKSALSTYFILFQHDVPFFFTSVLPASEPSYPGQFASTSLAFSNHRSLRLPVWELKGSWGAFPCATAARGSNLISGLKFELMI
jgi:hypothetical protein